MLIGQKKFQYVCLLHFSTVTISESQDTLPLPAKIDVKIKILACKVIHNHTACCEIVAYNSLLKNC